MGGVLRVGVDDVRAREAGLDRLRRLVSMGVREGVGFLLAEIQVNE